MSAGDPLAKCWIPRKGGRGSNLVAIDSAAKLETRQPGGAGRHSSDPSAVVIHVAGIAGAADDACAPVAQADFVVEPQAPRGDVSFRQQAQEVDWLEAAAKTNHFGPIDGGLQPESVMEGGVPVVDGSVIAAEGKFEVVVIVVADDGSFEINAVCRGLSRATKFAKVGDLIR